jgi:hypothetical protein
LNAFRHGLTGQIVIHTPEDQQAFEKHCDDIRGSLAPVGALETTLAQSIAEDYWRLNRARALENAVFTLGLQKNFGGYDDDVPNPEVETALALGRTWAQQNRSLQLLTTYEQRIRRSIEKNTAELRALQAARKAAVAQAEEKARLLVQLAEYEAKQGRNYDPSNDFPSESQPLGFVFSRLAVLRRSSSANASNRPRSSTGAVAFAPTARIPTTNLVIATEMRSAASASACIRARLQSCRIAARAPQGLCPWCPARQGGSCPLVRARQAIGR